MVDFEKLKQEIDLLSLAQSDTQLKKVASTGGGEWAGECPFCGGVDRFRVQPHHPSGARWFCRGCGENLWHDAIDYHQRKTLASSVKESAAELVGGAPTPAPLASKTKEQPIFPPAIEDESLWTSQAEKFIEESMRFLWEPRGKQALDYLRKERGLTDSTIAHWKLGLNPDMQFIPRSRWGLRQTTGTSFKIPAGLVIPCMPDKIRYIKIRQPKGQHPKYKLVDGSRGWLFGAETFAGVYDAFIFEGEFDTLVAWQEGWSKSGYKLGFGSFPANQEIRPWWLRYTGTIERYIIAHDMDQQGRASSNKLKSKLKGRAKIASLPEGYNDLSEFHVGGGDVFEWLYDQLGVGDDNST